MGILVAKSADFGSPWVNQNIHGLPMIHGFLPMGVGIFPPTSMAGTDWSFRGANPWVWAWVDPWITHVQPYLTLQHLKPLILRVTSM